MSVFPLIAYLYPISGDCHCCIYSNPDIPRIHTWLEPFSQSRKVSLSTEQLQAVETAAYSKIMVITGGPGVGKTFCTRTIVSLWNLWVNQSA